MKVGVIGCGGMGTTHLLALKVLSGQMDVEVAGVSDSREEYLEKALKIWPGVQSFSSGMELIENMKLDAIHICLPSYLHKSHAAEAMKRGMAVFIEKPVCLNEKDCIELQVMQKRTNAVVMVGHVVRFMKEYQYLKGIYDTGQYGDLKSLVMHRIGGFPVWGSEDWFSDPAKSGSVVLDLHIHDVDFIRYMLGEPNAFKSYGTKLESGMINQIITAYEYKDLCVIAEGTWDISPSLPFEAYFRACFENATLVFRSTSEKSLTVYTKEGAVLYPELKEAYTGESDLAGINISDVGPYYTEIKYFYECIEQGKEIQTAPLSEGIKSVELALQEYFFADANQYKNMI